MEEINGKLRRLSAFSTTTTGGNPAGVWIGDKFPDENTMQAIAADVGYSETAFIVPAKGPSREIRYFSPEAEVAFCGHATIASGVALATDEGDGVFELNTQSGLVRVATETRNGMTTAALTSVAPRFSLPSASLLSESLQALGWSAAELDTSIPPAVAYAGASHLVLAVREKSRLDNLAYDFDGLKRIMLDAELTTLQLVWRKDEKTFHVRNPFPVGGVVEDPATGAAAAAFGGYLREAALIEAPASLTLYQGEAMGRPSEIEVDIPNAGGIVVRGTAVPISG